MQKDFDSWNKARKIIETNRWGCSFYAGVCTSSQQRESWEVLSLTPIERPLGYSMTECSSKTKLESVENGNTALASGASSIVPRTMLQRAELVGISVASGTWMSRRKRRACGKRPTEAGQGNRTPRARSDKLDPAPCVRLWEILPYAPHIRISTHTFYFSYTLHLFPYT